MKVSLGFFIVILLFSFSCESNRGRSEGVLYQQYYSQGSELYKKHCSNCHQKKGEGLGKLYPPLANSDFLQANPPSLPCLIRFGSAGKIIVNKIEYNMPMPVNEELTNLQIAEILTYVSNSWGNKGKLYTVKEVEEKIEKCR